MDQGSIFLKYSNVYLSSDYNEPTRQDYIPNITMNLFGYIEPEWSSDF